MMLNTMTLEHCPRCHPRFFKASSLRALLKVCEILRRALNHGYHWSCQNSRVGMTEGPVLLLIQRLASLTLNEIM